jgi:hypothetical protein
MLINKSGMVLLLALTRNPNHALLSTAAACSLLLISPMSEEKSTEEQTQKIDAIVGDEVLGYEGGARGEHSGQETPEDDVAGTLGDKLADNRPEQT